MLRAMAKRPFGIARRVAIANSVPRRAQRLGPPVDPPSPSLLASTNAASTLSFRSFSSTGIRHAIVPFKLHDIGEGITEVEMLKWKVVEGQTVDHFDDLCEVQSDKSTAELTSPSAGVVHSIKINEGDMVKVGQVLCEIRTGDGDEVAPPESTSTPGEDQVVKEEDIRPVEETAPPAPAQPAHASAPSSSSPPSSPAMEDAPSAAEELWPTHDTEPAPMSTGVQFSGEASILPSAPARVSHPLSGDHPTIARRERDEGDAKKVVLSSPAVRSLATRLGVNLGDVTGTGEKGRVMREDVTRHAGQSSSTSPPSGSGAAPAEISRSSRAERAKMAEVTTVPFGRTRKVMYRALGAQAAVPHFGYSHTLDLTPLLPYLKAANPPSSPRKASYLAADIPPSLVGGPVTSATPGVKTTLLSFLVKTIAMAMEEHPIMRAKVVGADNERSLEIRRDGIIGVAVSDPQYGLVTPSLPPMDPSTGLSTFTRAIDQLRRNPTKMGQSANVVISSVGGLGEAYNAMPVIPPGGAVAICAVGQAKWEMEWNLRDGGMKIDAAQVEAAGHRAVLRCTVGWSGDHRVLEGAELIAFTESWKRLIAEPWTWMKID